MNMYFFVSLFTCKDFFDFFFLGFT